MAKELEFKYLVNNDSFLELAKTSHEIQQGYLSRKSGRSVRIRVWDDKGYITVKGPEIVGVGRDEFEYEIPLEDAQVMIGMCPPPVISKTRYIVPFEGDTWEVDVFHGNLKGLVTAEIEVQSYDHTFNIPDFVGRDVSKDHRFKNSNLTTFDDLKSAL